MAQPQRRGGRFTPKQVTGQLGKGDNYLDNYRPRSLKKSPGTDQSAPLEREEGLAESFVLVQTRSAVIATTAANRPALTGFQR